MWSSDRNGIFSAIVLLLAISGVVAKRPANAVYQWDYIRPDDYAFVARIVLNGTGEPVTCAGAIINSRHILTAGNCLHGKTGGTVYTSIQHGPDESVVVSGIDQLFLRNFSISTDGKDVQNDIGIVRLSNDLEQTARQRHISLPTAEPGLDLITWFAGWEANNDKGDALLTFKKTQIFLWDGGHCLKNSTEEVKAQKLCGQLPGADVCPGESGSPVLSFDGVLYGIASVDPCSGGSERQYTNVFHYIDWISSVINF